MWGEMVYRAGVGPAPCPVSELTTDILVEKLYILTSDDIVIKARELSIRMNEENGVLSALNHFCYSLPRDNMNCDVSLIMGESTLAKYRAEFSGIKLSEEVAATMVTDPLEYASCTSLDTLARNSSLMLRKLAKSLARITNPNKIDKFVPHGITTYALSVGEDQLTRNLAGAFCEFFRLLWVGLVQCVIRPDTLSYLFGCFGCICGFVTAPVYTVLYFLQAIIVCVDRISVGVANKCFGQQWLYFIDWSVEANVYLSRGARETLHEMKEHISGQRIQKIQNAQKIAEAAMQIFNTCGPRFRNKDWHWAEITTHNLKETLLQVDSTGGGPMLQLHDDELQTLITRLEKYENQQGQQKLVKSELVESSKGEDNSTNDIKDEENVVTVFEKQEHFISFSRFCLFIGEAVHQRVHQESLASESFVLSEEQVPLVSNNERDETTKVAAKIHRFSLDQSRLTVTIPIDIGEDDDDEEEDNSSALGRRFSKAFNRKSVVDVAEAVVGVVKDISKPL